MSHAELERSMVRRVAAPFTTIKANGFGFSEAKYSDELSLCERIVQASHALQVYLILEVFTDVSGQRYQILDDPVARAAQHSKNWRAHANLFPPV